MDVIYACLLLCFFWTCSYAQTPSCTTPLGETSQCVSLYECSSLLAAFKQRPLERDRIDFLRKSQCGFQGTIPSVCCGPLPSTNSRPTSTQRPRPTARPTIPSTNSGQVEPVVPEDSLPAPRDVCGEDSSSDRLYGGVVTDLDEFPWMALLGYRREDGSKTYQCGGVLINRRYVLTAAHCVVGAIETKIGQLASVRLGEYDTKSDVDCIGEFCSDTPQEIPVHRTFPHPGYTDNSKSRHNDIAVVRLAQRAKYTDFVKPICLVDGRARFDVGSGMYVAGWGKTLNGSNSPIKLKLSVPVFNKNECTDKYRVFNVDLSENQLCAGGRFAEDACTGDSGGPLMRRTPEGVWESAALVSFGYGCGRDGWPGVYTAIPGYLDWIRSTMKLSNV